MTRRLPAGTVKSTADLKDSPELNAMSSPDRTALSDSHVLQVDRGCSGELTRVTGTVPLISILEPGARPTSEPAARLTVGVPATLTVALGARLTVGVPATLTVAPGARLTVAVLATFTS